MSKLIWFWALIFSPVYFEAEISPVTESSDILTENASTNTAAASGKAVFFLEVFTDLYPEETTWVFVDVTEQDTIATSGGNLEVFNDYTLIIDTLSLDLDHCYEFTMFDDYGDGLFSEGQQSGTYVIKDQNGTPLVGLLQEDFGYEESNYFCPRDLCHLNYDIILEQPNTSDDNGSIFIDLRGGRGLEFRYSLNSGIAAKDPLFGDLSAGEYVLHVYDRHDCIKSEVISLTTTSVSEQEAVREEVVISPNPTNDVVQIEINGLNETRVSLPVSVYDPVGRRMLTSSIKRYGEKYKGEVSLQSFPDGHYYLRIHGESGDIMKKVVKQ